MERHFKPLFLGGEVSDVFSSQISGTDKPMDDSSLDQAMYSGTSLLSLLNLNRECGASTIGLPENVPATYGFNAEDFPAMKSELPSDREMKSVDYAGEKLKMPKQELSDYSDYWTTDAVPTERFDFTSKRSYPNSNNAVCDSSFYQLPDLRSLEQNRDDSSLTESSRKRAKSLSVSPLSSDPYTLESILGIVQYLSSSTTPDHHHFADQKPPEVKPPATVPQPQSTQARKRRQKISDKTRCLQKLLPWDKKMDMATMLEEAYKYVKFLQAQIRVLQSMPSDSSGFVTRSPNELNHHAPPCALGGLGRLNRQQLLQVLVNSPVAQTTLYSKGCCVYSFEQLILLKEIAERNALYQQMMFDPSLLS